MSLDPSHLIALLRVARCRACDGSGVVQSDGGTMYVTAEMAADAGDRSLEGQVHHHQEPEASLCQWCTERDAAIAVYESISLMPI